MARKACQAAQVSSALSIWATPRVLHQRWSVLVRSATGFHVASSASSRALAFGKNSDWRGEPSGRLASGSDIIDNTDGLEQHFIPLLTRS